MPEPLVSMIVPTRNSASTLEACLALIQKQTYSNIEVIVVDNNSTDITKEIAQKYTEKVFNEGPERSAQRNYGASESTGEFLVFIDSDMELSEKVIAECVQAMGEDGVAAVIIPEESFGIGFWAQCKKLERSFYVGIDWIEAARFCRKSNFLKVGGYDENIAGGEDWDLSKRLESDGKIARVSAFIYHNEGAPTLRGIVKKRFYYGKGFKRYISKNENHVHKNQSSVFQRYALFLRQPKKLFRNPILGLGVLFMKSFEFAAIALSLI